MSANTVIEAIKAEAELHTIVTLISGKQESVAALGDHNQTQAGYDLGVFDQRQEIAGAIKALPADALFYPESILKILKLH
jgi:hypothetical protein